MNVPDAPIDRVPCRIRTVSLSSQLACRFTAKVAQPRRFARVRVPNPFDVASAAIAGSVTPR